MTTGLTKASRIVEIDDLARRGRPGAGQDPAKRSQIIEGARRVFSKMGFDAASMNDITREAGVSKGTIYVYFANKEELFEALIEEERNAIFANLYEALERGDDIRETLIRYGTALTRKITSPAVLRAQRTVIGICERMPELGARFYERGPKRGHEKLTQYLARSVEAGVLDIADVRLAAYQFTTDKGAAALNEFARANDPFALIGKEQRAVDVSSVIRASPASFRIAWVERRYVDSQLAATERWTAILTVTLQPPRDAERLKQNPLGIYVHALNWSKELSQ